MLYVKNERGGREIYDGRINTAISNYMVNVLDSDERMLMLTINDPIVMIGRYQNAYSEVDQTYLTNHGIALMRRASGGGAVYHDRGNIMFSMKGNNQDQSAGHKHYRTYAEPLMQAISSLGVEVEASGRNDLLVNGEKFSGTSFYATPKHYMFGATIAYDLALDVAEKVLKPNKAKLKAHRVKSVKSRMTNIKPHLSAQYQDWTTENFRDYLLMQMFNVSTLDQVPTYILTEKDWAEIDNIAAEKFLNEDWNWQQRSEFSLTNTQRFSSGTYTFSANIELGRIAEIKVTGDFFAKQSLDSLEEELKGTPFKPEAIRDTLKHVSIEDYVSDWTLEELLTLLFKQEDTDD